ncbi:hypothetical protein D3C83_328010 [compost metagenome]
MKELKEPDVCQCRAGNVGDSEGLPEDVAAAGKAGAGAAGALRRKPLGDTRRGV